MKTKIHRKSLPAFLAMFGDVYKSMCAAMPPSYSTVYFAHDEFEPMMYSGVGKRKATPADFDETVHTVIRTNLEEMPGVRGVVVFENLDMSSANLGQRTAVMVGDGFTFEDVVDCRGKHLGDLPSLQQWPVAAYVNEGEDWDEVAINGEVHRELLCPGEDVVREMDRLCRVADPDCARDEKMFDKTVKFVDGKYMDIQVLASDQKAASPNEELDPCWTQGVLFDKDGNELGCTEVGGDFSGEYIVEHEDNRYMVVVPEPPQETRSILCFDINWDTGCTFVEQLPLAVLMMNVPVPRSACENCIQIEQLADRLSDRYGFCVNQFLSAWAHTLPSVLNVEIGPDMEIIDWNKPSETK